MVANSLCESSEDKTLAIIKSSGKPIPPPPIVNMTKYIPMIRSGKNNIVFANFAVNPKPFKTFFVVTSSTTLFFVFSRLFLPTLFKYSNFLFLANSSLLSILFFKDSF